MESASRSCGFADLAVQKLGSKKWTWCPTCPRGIQEQPATPRAPADGIVDGGRQIGNRQRSGHIDTDKSASEYQFLRLFLTTAHPAPGRCDHQPHPENAACTRGSVPSSDLKRGRAGTESDLVQLPHDDTSAHRSGAQIVRCCTAQSGLASLADCRGTWVWEGYARFLRMHPLPTRLR